jgi:SSS family solute:Na+ symporter
MLIGRIMTVLFVLIACFIAPRLANPKFGGVFRYIQEFQGYISPGIVAAFVFGFIIKKAPPAAGVAALLACVPVYGFLQWRFGGIAYLNRMAITFVAIIALMGVITLVKPLREPVILPVRQVFDMRPSRQVLWLGGMVIVGVIAFFIIFW